MAFEFDPNAIFKSACDFLVKGIRPVKLHGITGDGYCTCRRPGHHVNGSIKQQCGKHPIGEGWQHRAAMTEDDVAAWLDDDEPFNMGILLGPKSGIIDIEWDDDDARKAAEELGLTLISTPTYASGRSEHRLFQWDARLAAVELAVVHPYGLEVRLGVGQKGSQSVAPPSWHWTGRQYLWKPTLSISEVEVAPLPETLLQAIIASGSSGGPTGRKKALSARWAIHGEIPEGQRHPTLLGLCTKLVMRSPDYLSENEQEDILGLVWNTNMQNCKPPKTREEVAAILHSCISYRRKMEDRKEAIPTTAEEIEEVAASIEHAKGEDDEPPVSGYALHGLVPSPVKGSDSGEWLPGSWSIQMLHSDPPEIILTVPAWEKTPCKGKVAFSLDEFRSARQVASKVFAATRRVILDGDRGEWDRIWRGQEGNSKRPSIMGLMEKLMIAKDRTKDIAVGTSSLRFATLAGFLMESFARATKPKDEEKPEPNQSGRPCWVTPDELWFKWQKTWEEIGRIHDVQAGERIRIKHLLCSTMGVDDLPESRHTFGDTRHAYVVFSREWIEAVKTLAEGGSKQFPPNTGEIDFPAGENSSPKVRIPRLESEVLA